MDHEKQYPNGPLGLEQWIIDDLHNSGLTVDNFGIELLTSDSELKDRLGFTHFGVGMERILEVGGYWITYPNLPGYYRLKLKRAIDTEDGKAKYLSPSKKKGLGNQPYIPYGVEEALKNYSPDKPVFIAEGEKKSAKATLEGFPCIGLSGVWNWKDSENDFLAELDQINWMDRVVLIVFDSDINKKHSVRLAEFRLAIELTNRGAKVSSIRLPDEPTGEKNGLDDYLVRYETEALRELIKDAKPTVELHIEAGTDTNQILKELSRLSNEITIVKILKSIAKREDVNMKTVEAEYKKYLPKDKEGKAPQETFTAEQIEKAESLLNSPDILSRLLMSTKHMGFTGEEINQKMLYLSFTSRLMDSSISTIVKGQSSSGKSHLVSTILRLFPESDTLIFSFVTSKALVHRQGDLSHKILFIQEHSGSESSDYSVRTLLSEGEISIMLPVKNEITGKYETEEKRLPAIGLVFVETTTRDRIHHENQTRVFDLYVDESESQTANILSMQAAQLEIKNPDVTEEVKVWRAAQTLLKGHKVLIPYASELASAFPIDKTRARRDFPRLLSLISAHALLYQFQRKIGPDGRLIAELKDFEAVLPLAETVLAQSMKELSPKQEETLTIIQEEFSGRPFSVKELCEKAGRTPNKRTIQRYVEYFTKEGILEWNGIQGSQSRYSLSAPMSSCRNGRMFTPNLLETLKNKYDKGECRNVSLCRDSAYDYDDNDKTRQKQNDTIVSYDHEGLGEKTDVTTITTQGMLVDLRPKSLNEAGSTDPDDWEAEAQEFLRDGSKG